MHKLILSALIGSSLIACKPKTASPYGKEDLSFRQEARGLFLNSELDTLATMSLEVLDTDYSRNMGWAFRPELQKHQGVLFEFDDARIRSFYMKNTFTALDIIFILPNGKIDSYFQNAQPMDPSLKTSTSEVPYVLEVPAGSVERWQLQIGDQFLSTKVPH